MERIDENGVWEVTENEGSISQCLVAPSQKYIAEHPEDFQPKPPTAEERLTELELITADLLAEKLGV